MRDFDNAMAIAAQRAGNASQDTRIGVIESYDPNTYTVKVKLQPSGVSTGWIPIASPYVGNQWGLQVGPEIGDSVVLQAQEGGADAAIVVGSLFNDVDRPQAVPSGELWLKHKSGSLLKFLNNGDVQLVTSRDLLATVGRDLTVSTARNVTSTSSGFSHVTAATEVTIAAPVVTINAPLIGLNGQIVQTSGTGIGGVQMEGPVLVNQQVKSNTEVYAQTTPLHTHQHINGGGVGNSGTPTP